MTHSWLLTVAYAAVCAVWWILSRVIPLWRDTPRPRFEKPWREVGFVLCAVFLVLVLGQLWQRGVRFSLPGIWAPIAESVNQILIFSPVLAIPIIRRNGWESAWIRLDKLPVRLAIGLGLAAFALMLFAFLERDAPSWSDSMLGVFTPRRAHVAVQVLLEDIAIAILFVRLAAALGRRAALLAVAGLFAAAHIPAMVTRGDAAAELLGLFRDFGLVVIVIGTVWRSADVAWLWPVHYALDMTQFLTAT
jgi:hypothetical protein